jgi:hypothetical protein
LDNADKTVIAFRSVDVVYVLLGTRIIPMHPAMLTLSRDLLGHRGVAPFSWGTTVYWDILLIFRLQASVCAFHSPRCNVND